MFLKKHCTHEIVSDQEYLTHVLREGLRLRPPIVLTTSQSFSQDTQVGKYLLKAGDRIVIDTYGLHTNSDEWQRPFEFLPERFDSSHELFLRPDGKRRHPMSLSPFNGGKRICFGKTFGESSTRMACTYLTQFFDMEFIDKERYSDTHSLPVNHAG